MNQDWSIQHRADRCAVSGEPFRDGDAFYTLLFYEKGEFRREDLSEAAFKARNENIQPFSFWRSKFETPPPPPAPRPPANKLPRICSAATWLSNHPSTAMPVTFWPSCSSAKSCSRRL